MPLDVFCIHRKDCLIRKLQLDSSFVDQDDNLYKKFMPFKGFCSSKKAFADLQESEARDWNFSDHISENESDSDLSLGAYDLNFDQPVGPLQSA